MLGKEATESRNRKTERPPGQGAVAGKAQLAEGQEAHPAEHRTTCVGQREDIGWEVEKS